MSASTILACYAPPSLLFIAALARLVALLRNWRDGMLRSVCVLLVAGSLVLVAAAPPTVGVINAATGIPNVAAPFAYSVFTAFNGSCIILLLHWRGGDEARTRRATRLVLTAFTVVITALWVLFAVADAPVERRRDLDTFYATTPYMREMIVLYLLAHTVAAVTMVCVCWRWSRQVPGALRIGLATLAAGNVVTLAFDVLKYTAVGARWAGGDLDYLSTDVAYALAALSSPLIGLGFLIPPIGQRAASSWRTMRRYRKLRPLWHEVRSEIPEAGAAPLPWWSSAELRQLQRERDFHDAILRLGPYLDREIGDAVLDQALELNRPEPLARIEADAAVIAAAVVAKGQARGSLQPSERWTVRSDRDRDDLVQLSNAIATSPLVRATRASALAESSAT